MSIETKLGAFIVAALTVLFYLTFAIGGKKLFTVGEKRTLVVYFDSISGVTEKADVRMAGVKIGEVRTISLENYKAKLLIDIFGDLQIPVDSVAIIQGKGLLGEKYVEIKGGKSKEFLRNGGTLAKSITPANIDEIVNKISNAMDDIKGITGSLKSVLGNQEGEDGLKSIITNLSQLSKALNQAAGESDGGGLKNIVKNMNKSMALIQEILSENKNGIKETLTNIKTAAGNVNGVITDNKENFKIAMENLKKSSEKLDGIMASIKQISARLEKGEGTVGKLLKEDEVYNGINETLEGAKGLTKQVGAMRVAVGARADYLGTSNNYNSSTRSIFSIQVKPREDKYYMVELMNDTRKPIGTANSGGYLGSRGSLNSLLYTFYIAKRFGDVTFKAGLLESSGGGGVDFHAWDDKMTLSVDALNFSGYDQYATSPQIRVTAKYYIQKYFYVYAGGDELVNQYYRTFYAGIGILANEDDFKFFMARFF
jgi:phospholipid/cholesterol/gamma-HCH transport system substrate-binding protein